MIECNGAIIVDDESQISSTLTFDISERAEWNDHGTHQRTRITPELHSPIKYHGRTTPS